MEPNQAVSPDVWEKFSPQEKVRRAQEGRTYAFVELFIFEQNHIFPEYEIHSKKLRAIKTRHCMIDFRHLYRLNGEDIKNSGRYCSKQKCWNCLSGREPISETKFPNTSGELLERI